MNHSIDTPILSPGIPKEDETKSPIIEEEVKTFFYLDFFSYNSTTNTTSKKVFKPGFS